MEQYTPSKAGILRLSPMELATRYIVTLAFCNRGAGTVHMYIENDGPQTTMVCGGMRIRDWHPFIKNPSSIKTTDGLLQLMTHEVMQDEAPAVIARHASHSQPLGNGQTMPNRNPEVGS